MTKLTRRALLATTLATPALAQSRLKVKFAGGGVALYGYMPFFVATGRQLWQKHGIDPEIAMFPGGAPAMQAVLGGSSQIACGYYEHTIQMAAKGAKLQAFVLQAQNSGLALGVRKALDGQVKTIADLKGRKIGVSAPGSATHMFALQLLAKSGLKATDISAIGVGTTQTAMSSFERGDIDALSLFDPIMIDLEQRNLVTVLADARNTAGSTAIFGGPYASGSLYGDAAWLEKNPDAARAAAAAILEAVTFLRSATAREALESLEKGMCFLGAPVCDAGFARNREAFQHNGRISLEQAATVRRMLDSFNPEIAAAKIDLSSTFTTRFLPA
jgi:NitT/TauT family transport system substrate-binding protein